jgi:putative hydrolase of the HAD superfamily
VPPALLVDYGEVISLPQPQQTLARMAELAGLDVPAFVERYWEHRPAYDRGLDARGYWSRVMGTELSDDATVRRLIELDMDSWSELNGDTLEILREVHSRGIELSLLSNAPHELADLLTGHPALERFEHLLFSARLGVMKPDPAVFAAALQTISRKPDQVLFIDDRPVNVEGARAAGLHALLFTSAAELRRALLG